MTANKPVIQLWLGVLICFFAIGCEHRSAGSNVSSSSAESPAKASVQSKTDFPRNDAVVKLDPRMMANIKVEELSEKVTPSILTATGKLNFNEDRMARILAPVAGQIVNLKLKVGDSINAGQSLFYVNSREAAAAISEYLENRKDLELAEKTYSMTKDLYEHEAASRISLQQAENDLAKAKARTARSEYVLKVFNLSVDATSMDSKFPVRSPINGKVVERSVTEGQFVQADSNPLMIIADLANLWVVADIYENDLRLISQGQRAEVTTAAYPNERFTAELSRISDVVDPTTRTVKVRFVVSNPAGRLKPEMFASVKIFINEQASIITVPANAVFTEGGKNYVYVQTGTTEFTRRTVEVLPDPSGRMRVTSGIKSGEKVVSERAMLVNQEASQKKE